MIRTRTSTHICCPQCAAKWRHLDYSNDWDSRSDKCRYCGYLVDGSMNDWLYYDDYEEIHLDDSDTIDTTKKEIRKSLMTYKPENRNRRKKKK